MNFYKHHIGDFDSHTKHLTWDERAAYQNLIGALYSAERALPLDHKVIHRIIGATKSHQKAATDKVLAEFFTKQSDGYHNKRCDEEIARYQAQATTNRRIARQRIVNESSANRTPNHKPLTTNQEPPDISPGLDVPYGEPDLNPNEINSYLNQPTTAKKGNGEIQWWKSNQGIDAKGRELGMIAATGDDYPTFKDKIFKEIARRRQAE